MTLGREQISADAFEVALDVFELNDGLDTIDGRTVTVVGQPRALASVQPENLFVAGVDLIREMCRGHARLSTSWTPVVQNHDGVAFSREKIRGGEPRHSGANDAHIRHGIGHQRSEAIGVVGVDPE